MQVASGQNDVFWQYEPVLPGVAAGILLVTEAGGTASRIDGSAWRPGSPDILVTNAALHPPPSPSSRPSRDTEEAGRTLE